MSLVCDWLVLCERVSQDADSNNLVILQTLDTIRSVSFPALHRGFAFACRFHWEGEPSTTDRGVGVRLVRWSSADDEEVVVEAGGEWKAGTTFGRTYLNFEVLRVFRPGIIWFRVDLRVDDGEWLRGNPVPLEVKEVEATAESLERRAARKRLVDEFQGVKAKSKGPKKTVRQ